MTKLTKEEKGELDAMLSEYVLRSGRFINEKDPTEKVNTFHKVLDMKNQIFTYIEKIKG